MIRYTTFSAPKAEILDLIFNYAFIEDKLCLFDRDTAYICNYAFIDSKFYILIFLMVLIEIKNLDTNMLLRQI